eukprot:Gb_02710 [translate_table: standard]
MLLGNASTSDPLFAHSLHTIVVRFP